MSIYLPGPAEPGSANVHDVFVMGVVVVGWAAARGLGVFGACASHGRGAGLCTTTWVGNFGDFFCDATEI